LRQKAAVARMRGKRGGGGEEEDWWVLPLLLLVALDKNEGEGEGKGRRRSRTRVQDEKNAAARSSLWLCRVEGGREGEAARRRSWAAR